MSISQNLILQYLKEKFIELGFDVSEKKGSLLSIKSHSGKEYQIDERILDLLLALRLSSFAFSKIILTIR